jgi:hypothetical protein
VVYAPLFAHFGVALGLLLPSASPEIALRRAKKANRWGRKNVQKKFKKLLTDVRLFAILSAHTVNT